MSSVKLSKEISDKIGLYLLAGIVVLVAAWFLFISPKLSELEEINVSKQQTQTEIDDLEKLKIATEELRENFQEIALERDRILALLPIDTDEDRLLALLSQLQDESSVVLASFTPDYGQTFSQEDSLGAAGIGSYTARVGFTGSYQQINRFLELLANSARYIDIVSYSIGGGGSSDDPELDATFTIQSFYQLGSGSNNNGEESGF